MSTLYFWGNLNRATWGFLPHNPLKLPPLTRASSYGLTSTCYVETLFPEESELMSANTSTSLSVKPQAVGKSSLIFPFPYMFSSPDGQLRLVICNDYLASHCSLSPCRQGQGQGLAGCQGPHACKSPALDFSARLSPSWNTEFFSKRLLIFIVWWAHTW